MVASKMVFFAVWFRSIQTPEEVWNNWEKFKFSIFQQCNRYNGLECFLRFLRKTRNSDKFRRFRFASAHTNFPYRNRCFLLFNLRDGNYPEFWRPFLFSTQKLKARKDLVFRTLFELLAYLNFLLLFPTTIFFQKKQALNFQKARSNHLGLHQYLSPTKYPFPPPKKLQLTESKLSDRITTENNHFFKMLWFMTLNWYKSVFIIT